MIYFFSHEGESWAKEALEKLGYNSEQKYQIKKTIELLYKILDKKIIDLEKDIYFTDKKRCVSVQLSEVLDGNDPDDYFSRVEPSQKGGKKIAKLLVEKIVKNLH